MKKLRIGLIGAGASRILYAPVIPKIISMELVALADPNPDQRKLFIEALPVKRCFDEVETMLRETELDGMMIASPPKFHAEHTELVAKQGLHVFCEKPMARTVAEAERMIQACRDANVHLGIGFNRRAMPAMKTASELIRLGHLGKVFHLECIWTSWTAHLYGGWRDDRDCLGGTFQDHGAHTLDLATQWLGPIDSVVATAHHCAQLLEVNRQVEDGMTALVQHHNGSSSIHVHSRASHRPISESYRIYGTAGTLEIEFTGNWAAYSQKPFDIRLYKNENLVQIPKVDSRYPNDNQPSLTDAQYGSYQAISNWVKSVKRDENILTTNGQAGLENTMAVSATYIAAHENTVTLITEGVRFDANMYERFMEKMTHG